MKPTRLAPVSLLLRYDALVIRHATVNSLILHRPLEETLAAFAGDDTVMKSSCFVLADHANLGR